MYSQGPQYRLLLETHFHCLLQKLIGHFRTFFNWSLEKDYHKNVGVKFYNKSVSDNLSEKDVIYLFRDEVKKLYELKDIEYENSKHRKHTNELVVDVLKNGEKRVYTNLEFCRDLFLFQCGLGTRFGDTIKLKIEHFDFKNKEFKIYMEKTNRSVRVPINEMTEKVFRKYSKDKSKDDFIFPKTISGNFYPNQNSVKVHPGEIMVVTFTAKNITSEILAGQAIPSLSPGQASPYFKKIECFCFSQQTFQSGETRTMPVVFVVDPEMSQDLGTVTLSYTFFEAPKAPV